MREKLIELLRKTRYEYRQYIGMKDMEKRMAKTDEEFLTIDDSIMGEIPFCADYLIANGVTVQQWIPVTKRMPTREDANETESILAIHKADGYVGRWIWDIVVRYPKEFTHWMPLPQLPKES